jgi:hypothetical protein
VHVDHDFLAWLVPGFFFVEGETGERVTAHAVTVEKFHRARCDLMGHRPVIPGIVQANDDYGGDLGGELFVNASPKGIDGPEASLKKWEMPLKVAVLVVFRKAGDGAIEQAPDLWDTKSCPQSRGKFARKSFTQSLKHFVQIIFANVIKPFDGIEDRIHAA